MQLVGLIIVLNVLRCGSSYPSSGQNNQETSFCLEPESQNDINTILDNITEFLCNLLPQYREIDISELAITVRNHSDKELQENTPVSIVVNDFTEDDAADDCCDEEQTREDAETTSALKPDDEITNSCCLQEAGNINGSVIGHNDLLESNEESQTITKDNEQCYTGNERIDGLDAKQADAKDTEIKNKDITIAFVIDSVKPDEIDLSEDCDIDIIISEGQGQLANEQENIDCCNDTNNEKTSHNIDIQDNHNLQANEAPQGIDREDQRAGIENNGITIDILIDDLDADAVDCTSNTNDEHNSDGIDFIVQDNRSGTNGAAQVADNEGQQTSITVAFLFDNVKPYEKNVNCDDEDDVADTRVGNENESTLGDQGGITIALLTEDVKPEIINCSSDINELEAANDNSTQDSSNAEENGCQDSSGDNEQTNAQNGIGRSKTDSDNDCIKPNLEPDANEGELNEENDQKTDLNDNCVTLALLIDG